jgi:hypothetical protein
MTVQGKLDKHPDFIQNRLFTDFNRAKYKDYRFLDHKGKVFDKGGMA